MSKHMKEWTDSEVDMLLQTWDNNMFDLRKTWRNTTAYEKMREELAVENIDRTVVEIRRKMKSMHAKYRKEKQKSVLSGGLPSTWQFYGHMHELVGSFACNDDSLITESITNYGTNFEQSITNYDSQPQDGDSVASTSAEHDEFIMNDDSISNPPLTIRCRAAKRKLSTINEDLLREFKRANKKAEDQFDTTNIIAAKANEIAKETLNFMKLILKPEIK